MDKTPRQLYYGKDKITRNASKHPAFRQVALTMASLYDMQHDPKLVDEMTYSSPTSGKRVGMSFLQPRSKPDLARRTRMIKIWADSSLGVLGRTPDYLNSAVMAMAGAAEFFGKGRVDYAENIHRYYEYIRENDLLLTHTLINPQVNRSLGPSKQADPFTAARIAEKKADGVLVRGARMLATFPLADEILVFPSVVIRSGQDDMPYAMAFALPLSTPGLRLICRESFVESSTFDHPLASRFDEQDAVVVFDDVLVPWERIFLLEDPERANIVSEATDAVVFMSHQSTVREIAKVEFILGLTTLMAETIGADQFPHVQEKIAEVIMTLETMKSFVSASEANAKINKWGIMTPDFSALNAARTIWPRIAPNLVTIIKQIGASGLMAIPPESVLNSEVRPDIDRYYQAKLANAEDRIRLFKLAWDIVGSSFAGRQELYERFFFGDPVRTASNLYNWYDKEPYKERVKQFLHQENGRNSSRK